MTKQKGDRIWGSINFSEIDRESKKKEKKKANKYLVMVKALVKELVGTHNSINIEFSSGVVNVLISRSHIGCDFRTDGDYFLLYSWSGGYTRNNNTVPVYKTDDDELFKSIVKMNINQILIPNIKDFYKKGHIKTLPSKIIVEEAKMDFTKLTKKWLEEKFQEISYNVMNGETIENVKIKINKKSASATFDIDCARGGLFRGHGLTVSDKGFVKVDLDETPIEGCGIETDLAEAIEELIKN